MRSEALLSNIFNYKRKYQDYLSTSKNKQKKNKSLKTLLLIILITIIPVIILKVSIRRRKPLAMIVQGMVRWRL